MQRLILVRHGETEHNTDGRGTGHIDVGLTDRGVEQARNVAERLAEEEDVASIYSSDLERASRTADIIAEKTGAEREETEKLRERTFGVYDGEKTRARREELEHGDELDDWRPEGGENLGDVQDRVREVIDGIEESYAGDTVVLVSHCWTNRALITALLGSGSGHAHQIIQDNACIDVFEKEDFRGWRLVSLNDTRHLE